MQTVIVVGAGVIGCATARELSRFHCRVHVLEAADDVAEGATKANSAIVHAGFDAAPGTRKAAFNVAGNARFEKLCRELGVEFVRNGSLVVAFSESERTVLEKLLQCGRANGVPGLEILDRAALRAREPRISPEAEAALWAPTGGITCPYDLTFRLAENAAANGTAFRFNARVTGLARTAAGWRVTLAGGETLEAAAIVNAAGAGSAGLNNLVSARHYRIEPRRGEYVMLDRAEAGAFTSTVFQVPTAAGKGVLVSPTVDGTIIVGPTSDPIADASDTATTAEGLERVIRLASRVWPAFPKRSVIAAFSGVRAHEATGGDFVVGEAPDAPGFFNALGIESPGLSAAPAIGAALAEAVAARLGAERRAAFSGECGQWPHIRNLKPEAIAAVVARDAAYGRIVCRCETVTEGEIRAAIRCRVGARNLDGLKRRTRSGMGRCQGGFCTLRLIEILSEELGVSPEAVTKFGGKSFLLETDHGRD